MVDVKVAENAQVASHGLIVTNIYLTCSVALQRTLEGGRLARTA